MHKGIVLSLFDFTGNMVRPWAEAGYLAVCFDQQHDRIPEGRTEGVGDGAILYCHADLLDPDWLLTIRAKYMSIRGLPVAAVFAFPPCDHLAVSGARGFKGKGLRKLAESIALFAAATEVCEAAGARYMIENPVSMISSYWRKPDYSFQPWEYAGIEPRDNYKKRTCLWTGNGFVMPEKRPGAGEPDNRMANCPPGPNRKNFRSATPTGFARAVFEANQ